MRTLDKITKPFIKATYISAPPKSVVIFVPLIPKNHESVLYLFPYLNVSRISFNKVFIPLHRANVKGVNLDTYKTVANIKELISSAPSLKGIRLVTNFANVLNSVSRKSLIVDFFPVFNQLNPYLEKYGTNYAKYWDLWFELFFKEFEKLLKYKTEFTGGIYPVFVSNIVEDEDIEKLNEFERYIKARNYKIDVFFEENFYYAVPGYSGAPVVSILGKNVKGKYIEIFRQSLTELVEISSKELEFISQRAHKVLSENDINETVKKVLVHTEVYIEEIFPNEEERNKIKKFLENSLREFVSDKNINPEIVEKDPARAKEIIRQMLKEKFNVKNVDNLSDREIFEILKMHYVDAKLLSPSIVDKKLKSFVGRNIKSLNTETTVSDLHEKEFNQRIDGYIKTLFKSLEETYNLPIEKKILNVKKELVDDKKNRYWLYTFTIQNKKNGETYDVQIKIPALINERYFKLNGKTYILSNQKFLKPITVTDKNKARFLSYYAIVTLALRNYKLVLNNVNTLIDYIIKTYPNIVKDYERAEIPEEIIPWMQAIEYKFIEFKDGDTIYGYNPIGGGKFLILENKNKGVRVVYDSKTDKLIEINDKEGNEIELPFKLNEYLTEVLIEKIQSVNPRDTLATTKNNLPYVEIYLGGLRMPYILFLFGNFGVRKSLEKLGIEYSIEGAPDAKAYVHLMFKDKVVNIYPKTKKEKFIINGLLPKIEQVNKLFKNVRFEEFENNQEVRDKYLDALFGEGAARMNLYFRRFMVDPITRDVLKAEGYSTDYFNILTKDLPEALFNSKIYKPTDLRIHRARLSEVVLHILYKQLAQAKTELERRLLGLKEQGKKIDESYTDKYYINPDYVIEQLLQGESLLQYTEPVNPVDELNVATRITPKGIGGLPNDAISLKHRLIPFEKDKDTGKWVSSYFNNVASLDTNEYSNVGSNNQLTWKALITDKYGLFINNKNIDTTSFESLGIGESLAPFIQGIDHDRAIKMAQQLRQVIPIENPSVPHVASGAEFLIPAITSSRFTARADKDGKVVDIIEDKYIIVQFDDGTKKMYNIMPRLSRIKRGIFMPVKLIPTVKKGQIVKKGDILATTKQLIKGVYAYGKNVCVAISTYAGKGYEDAWVVSEKLLKQFAHKKYQEVIVIVPPDTQVDIFKSDENTPVKFGETLLRFKYQGSLEDYENEYNILQSDEIRTTEDLEIAMNKSGIFKSDKGIEIRSPVDGVIKDVRIYINGRAPKEIELVWKKKVNQYKYLIDTAKEINGKDDYSFEDSIDTSMFTKGGHTFKGNEFKGALIMFLIEHDRIPSEGDKFVFRGGNKGVVGYIIPEGKEPITEVTKLEVEVFHNPLSNIGRKNTNFFKEVLIGKVMYFLNKKAKEMAQDSKVKTEEIKNFVIEIYESLVQSAPENTKEVIKGVIENIQNTPNDEFRENCKNLDPKDDPYFIWLAIPFHNVSEKDIANTLKKLGIPAREKIYYKEFGFWSERPITVGFAYFTILEHMPDIMAGARSTGKYSQTGQGAKGESRKGEKASQSFDTLTLTGILERLGEDSEVIKELFTVQSDDHTAKNYVLNKIIKEGRAPDDYPRGETGSKNMMKAILYGLHINPKF